MNREASLANVLMSQNVGERQSWDVRFRRSFNDWEMELVGAFLHLLESHNPLYEAGD